MLGGWCYSIAAIVESKVAAEDGNYQEAATHLQIAHYYSCLLSLPLEQQYHHDVPQTMTHCLRTHYYYLTRAIEVEPVDQHFARILQLHHPLTFAVSLNGNAGVLLSFVSISPSL